MGSEKLFSPEAEQSVLGAVFLRPAVLDEVVEVLKPEDFYRPAHGLIFQAMLDLWGRQEPVDTVTVTDLLKRRRQLTQAGGPFFLASLGDQVGTAANAGHYARLVRDLSRVRRFRETLLKLADKAVNGLEDAGAFLDEAEAEIYRAVHRDDGGRGQPVPVGQVAREVLAQLEAQRRDSLPPGLQTGFFDLDARIGGLEPGNLYVVAARPGMGKTALALNIAVNVARSGQPVLFLSLETGNSQLTQRLLAALFNLSHQHLRDGQIDEREWERLVRLAEKLDLPLYLDDQSAMTHLEVRARSRRAAAKWGIRLLVVDYLQLVSAPEAKSREQEVAAISRSFKALAKELDVPVLVLSQLNRACEARQDKRPVLSDLRESGAIEQDSDVVAFLYRDDYYREDSPDRGVAELLVRKNRHGPTGTVKLQFEAELVTFRNLAREEVPF
ncbi:MAG: replicative DNA helicase [Deltaproteobacteria bacterium]|nr:replicative DNA helicase [Deltaproteobacteria bacterium]